MNRMFKTKSSSKEDDFEITVVESTVSEPEEGGWPGDDFAYASCIFYEGKVETPLPVVVELATFDAIRTHADENLKREIGGILLGRYLQDGDRRFVKVTQSLRADAGESYPGAFDFTVEALLALEHDRETRFSDLAVVGWYHSHPGFGVFYSSLDAYSHRTQFRAPFHVGMVVDPHARQAGFFVWNGSELQGPCGFWVAEPKPKIEKKGGQNV